jgi:cell division septation protein DedD
MVVKKMFLVLSLTALLGVSGCSRQQSDWQKTRGANTAEAYEVFLKKYPSGEFTAQAQARLKELYEERDWQKARDADTLEAYQAFLKQYPEGKWTEEARIRVENFTLAAAPSAPPSQTTTPSPGTPLDAAPPPARTAPPPAPVHSAVPASKAHPAKADAGANGVQLGAFKSGAAAANKRWKELETQYPKILGGLTPRVAPQKTASGTLYRLQVVKLTDKRAGAICKALKDHSQPCVILHPGHA